MNFWEFVSYIKENADAFYADAKAHNYDVEEVFHATPETDGRALSGREWWAVTAYVDFNLVDDAVVEALQHMSERYGMEDWGSEPSTSFDSGERDGSVSAHA